MHREIVAQVYYKQHIAYDKQYNIQSVIYSVIHIILNPNLEIGLRKDYKPNHEVTTVPLYSINIHTHTHATYTQYSDTS